MKVKNDSRREEKARAGLKKLLRSGAVTPSAVLACPDLVDLLRSGEGASLTREDAAVAVSASIASAVRRLDDADAASLLFSLEGDAPGRGLGDRRVAAAAIAGVTPESFRVRREPRIIDQLARELLLDLNPARTLPARRAASGPSLDTERRCPSCGASIRLGDCPVIATDPAQGHAVGAPVSDPVEIASALGDSAEPPRQTSARADGAWVTSRIDGVTRPIISRPPLSSPVRRSFGRTAVQALPSPLELATGIATPAARPARACPVCSHPLPATIDYVQPYVIAIVGLVAASKTSTAIALVHGVRSKGPSSVGLRTLALTETSFHEYKHDLRLFERGDMLAGTPRSGHQRPMEFVAQLDDDAPVTVLVQDGAGEDFADPNRRLHSMPLVLWADAVIFVYNPECARGFASDEDQVQGHAPRLESDTWDQAALLDGIRDDLDARGIADDGRYPEPRLFVALSKADLLGHDATSSDAQTEHDVRQAITALGDQAFIYAADRWRSVKWRQIAPLPRNGESFGVLELFRDVLAPIRGANAVRPFAGIGSHDNHERLTREEWDELKDMIRANGGPAAATVAPEELDQLNNLRARIGLPPYFPYD